MLRAASARVVHVSCTSTVYDRAGRGLISASLEQLHAHRNKMHLLHFFFVMNRMHKAKCILFGFVNAKIHISGVIEYF
jgi:hypothetical protein